MNVLLIPDLYEEPTHWQAVVAAITKSGHNAEIYQYETPRSTDLSDIVTDLARYLIDTTYVIGYGIGGKIAIQLAAQNPHHLAGTMLISTPAVPAPGVGAVIRRMWRFVTTPIRIIIPFYIRQKFIALLRRLQPGDPKKKLYNQIAALSMESYLSKVTDPVLLLWGEHNTKTKPRVAEAIVEVLAEFDKVYDLQIVAGATDALHITHPKIVVSAALSAAQKITH